VGVKALLFDTRGYAGLDRVPVDAVGMSIVGGNDVGSKQVLSQRLANRDDRDVPYREHECLVRDPGSLARRVSALVDAAGGLNTTNAFCGRGTP
jgi:hypothetical protein